MDQSEHSDVPTLIGVLGGTITTEDTNRVETTESSPTLFGNASAPLRTLEIGDSDVVFMARHGLPHTIAPHEINYRANLWTFYEASASAIIGMYTVGAIADNFIIGDIVIPNQIIDYTWGREGSFNSVLGLNHFDLSEPFDPVVRNQLISSALESGYSIHTSGTYGCTQGPRLETAAEIERLRRDGCDLVGMTAMPEVALARELNIPFGGLCLVVNAAAGRGDGPIQHHGISLAIERNSPNLLDIVGRAAHSLKEILR
ncbi:MAG: 5'-methylthioadenosine phosphorylase [Gammaproteobacteria bacterium]|nr:5'-methylthioadenosine phosphorylase [Gammaproteobacteria bacterium]